MVLTHGSVLESTLGSRELIGTLNQRVLQFSNYTFDVSVWVCFHLMSFDAWVYSQTCPQDWSCTLTSGGTLCIVPKQKLIEDLANVGKGLDITFLQTTPTGE